ncbi:hypothetical protein E1A91_D07G177600v1 [Gossypium mustelinum]|uniref:ATPase AAA-type core domain-containing protein n=1 Tax=Gossypium mustelinum TaxID=34275 RepID=A0A5D2U958_GOSMU|nr:hypothetical protein E1A91_D07G177600v1 [Gossypium mustelinum]
MGQGIPGGLNRQGLPGDKKPNGSDKKDKKFEPAAPPARVGSKQHKQKGSEVVAWLPTVTPLSKCKLQLLKLEQIKDYLLMEEEFVVNQKRLKPQEEKAEEDRFKFDDLRGSSMSGVGLLQDGIDPMVLVMKIQEIKEVVELPLTHPELYEDIGIKPPKEVILYGEPGTNKTLLAKAVANSTSVTFLCVVGSELIQKYLGDGPKLVRELFKRTMLELLNQLDDFDFREDVKVILATNRIESIDPVLLCPESVFSRYVMIHTSRMTLADDVNLEEFVMTNDEFSGADIKALCIETGLLTLRERCMKV